MKRPGRIPGFYVARTGGSPGTSAGPIPVSSSIHASGRRCPGCTPGASDIRTVRRPRACVTGSPPPDDRRTLRTAATWPDGGFPTESRQTTRRRFWSSTCPVNERRVLIINYYKMV